MRTLIKTLAFAALCCCYAACQIIPEEVFPEETRLTATIEAEPDTRTTITPSGEHSSSIIWSEGDILSVFIDGSTQAVPFTLSEGAGTGKGVFNGKGGGNSYTAFYPSSMIPSRGTGTLRLTLPSEQTYSPGTFSTGTYPMVAVSDSPELHFRNIASVIRLSITGYHEVTRIVFRSNDPEAKVSGKAMVSLSDPSRPELTMVSGAVDSLVLTVPRVKLDEKTATDFYLVVPPQTYKKGFSVRVYTDERFMDKVYSSSFTTVRSLMHKSDPFVFKPNGIDNSTYLEGSGTDSDPFLIRSIADLILMRDAINAGDVIKTASGTGVSPSTASYLLTADIDMGPACSKSSGKSWIPIADYSHDQDLEFKGVFDGGGHVISGLYINNSNAYQGLFGVLNQASIKNLTVEGDLNVGDYSGMLAGSARAYPSDCRIDNCHTKGVIKGWNYVGGLLGNNSSEMVVSYCSNEASVQGRYRVGGICGYNYGAVITNCRNSGAVEAAKNYNGSYFGGITGYINYGRVYNSTNVGDINGYNNIGGIAGYVWQGGKILNSNNFGTISASRDYAGGICGYFSSDAALPYMGEALVVNCYNAGKVSCSGEHTGALAGFAGMRDDETPGEYDDPTAAWVKDSYWISDGEAGMEKAVGGGPGITENNHALTEAQMKGRAAYDGILYTMADGSSYSKFIDALNAGASEWGAKAMALPASLGGYNPETTLNGWIYASSGSYPSLTDLKAVKPGGGEAEFSISAKEFSFNAMEGKFQVDVTSSADYSLGSLPGWISRTEIKGYDSKPHTKTYFFNVSANTDTQERSAVIQFTNKTGTALKVAVKQMGMYLETGRDELVLTGEEGAKSVTVSSSVAWNAESDTDWCILPATSGIGDGVISVQVSANPSSVARMATITVSSYDGSMVRTVGVLQSGAKEGGEEVDWTTHEFVHKSVAMRFTATWCGWCPRMNKSVRRAQELYPDKISYVALHNNDSDLAFNQIGPLRSQYGINAFPTGLVDGRVQIKNDEIEKAAQNIVNAVKETEEKYGTVTGVGINSSVSGRQAQVDVSVYAKKAGDYKITVLLLEDGIVQYQADYEEGDHPRYAHDCIARVAMSNVLGDSFNVAKDNSVIDFSFSANVSSSYNLGNMHVLVYVQRTFKPYQVIQSGSYGDYFIDNSAEVALGENLKLALVGVSGGGGGGSSSSGGSGDDNEGIRPGGDIDM